jgi:hypothetical protein
MDDIREPEHLAQADRRIAEASSPPPVRLARLFLG